MFGKVPSEFQPPVINDKYLNLWTKTADGWGPYNGKPHPRDIAPDDVNCKLCWDTGLCAECLGEYGPNCPGLCGDGRCSCQK